MKGKSTHWVRRNLDLALFASVAGAFTWAAAVRLGTYPVYETDESYILQVAYEILNRGKLALPMYRFLGGNIENVWHSFTPLYFFSLSGFLKVFGFGVLQGRAFNLIAAVSCLTLVYLIGRRLFNWRVGLIAVIMMASDPTVLQRARMIRNDHLAEALALLAFYLYEIARQRKGSRYYVLSGLAAGAGMMCHPSILYMIIAISLLMIMRRGRRIFRDKTLYQYAAGVLAPCVYEIVYDAIDYKNLLLQYRGDNLHFGILSVSGLWSNLLDEPTRYARWYRIYDVTFQAVPLTLLHVFQLLIAASVIYLIIRAIRAIRLHPTQGPAPGLSWIEEPSVRLLVVTLVAVLFAALALHKAGYYNIHLITWFSLCVGVLLSDGFQAIWRSSIFTRLRPAAWRAIAASFVALLVVSYASLLARQYRSYLKEVRSPDAASSVEINSVIGDVVPSGLCPVAVMAPVLWLSFQNQDECFATLERRMSDAVRIDGKDYALIMRPKASDHWAWGLSPNRHLLGQLIETPYGNLNIYYTGADPSYLSIPPRRYYLFGQLNGHASQEQVDAARPIWSAKPGDAPAEVSEDHGELSLASEPRMQGPALPASIQLKPRTIYSIQLNAASPSDAWELVVTDCKTGRWLRQIPFADKDGAAIAADLFRTLAGDSITLQLRRTANEPDDSFRLTSAEIKEVASIESSR